MIKVGIIGGTGYTGAELLRLLAVHPDVELAVITSRGEAGKPVADLFPNLRHHVDLAFSELNYQDLTACDVVFTAMPNGISMTHAPSLLEAGVKLSILPPISALKTPPYGSNGTARRTPARSCCKRRFMACPK